MITREYSFRQFKIRPLERKLLADELPVAIGARAFDLLVALIEARDRTVSKDELLRAVWPDTEVGDNNLTVAISALRKVLREMPNEQTTIRTVFGKGYRFVAPLQEHVASAPAMLEPPMIDAPSIAVLPFSVMSDDPAYEHFGDGIAEDIITELSRNRWLTVIARSSSFTYKDAAVSTEEVVRAFGVRYVLEGSVRSAGSRVRVTAQLVDAGRNVILAERFDRDLADIFALQDEITALIVSVIRPALYEAEEVRSVRRRPESIDAWSAYQRGVWHFKGESEAESREARHWFERAMTLDPGYAPGYYGMALVLLHDGSANLAHAVPDWQQVGERLAEQAVALDPRDSGTHSVLALARRVRGDNVGALEATGRALALNPSDAAAHGTAGATLVFDGHPLDGLLSLATSIRLSPRDPRLHIRHCHLGIGHFLARQLDAAEATALMMIRRWPEHSFGPRLLAAVVAEAGRIPEAQAAFRTAYAMSPKSFDDYTHARMPWFRREDFDRVLAALRLAGLESPAE